uniref:Uncharacterized protein n=1 Tax=Plectus sambesii TaxID=2011161 RepID=A0A914WZR7_9BILA
MSQTLPQAQVAAIVIPQVLIKLSPLLAAEELMDIAFAATLLNQGCHVLKAALLSTGLSLIVCVLPHVGISIPPLLLLERGLIMQPNLLGKGLETLHATLFYLQQSRLQCTPLIFVGDEQAGLLNCHSPPCADRAIHCFPGISTDAFASLFTQQYFLLLVAIVVISIGLTELTHCSQELVGHYWEVLDQCMQCMAWPHIHFIIIPPLSSRVVYKMHIELSQALHQLCQQHKVIFADILPSFQQGLSFHSIYFADGWLSVFGVDLVLMYL